jgi:predicted enzyme related to lactoylglutathione lyase
MQGKVSFIELGTAQPDVERSRLFFEKLFGWQFHPMPRGGWFQAPSMRVGLHGSDPGPQIYLFFEVSDLEQAIAVVRESGGEADAPVTEEGDFGRFASCRDPQGIRFGLHQRVNA